MIPLDVSNPSISASKLIQCLFTLVISATMHGLSRLLPIASISSIKIIHGAICCACLNKITYSGCSDTDKHLYKSEPESEKNGTPASPATAFGKQCLTSSRRAYKQCSFWKLRTDLSIFLGIMQKIYHLPVSDSFASSCPCYILKMSLLYSSQHISWHWTFQLPSFRSLSLTILSSLITTFLTSPESTMFRNWS